MFANTAIELEIYKRNPTLFPAYNLPLANGQHTNLYQLDVLLYPKAPCDVRDVKLDVYDTTDEREKISRGHIFYTKNGNAKSLMRVGSPNGFLDL